MTRMIRIDDIPHSDLAPERKLALTAIALQELAMAQALVLMHGEKHGAELYTAHGGHVRYDDDGEPVIAEDAQVPVTAS